MSHSSQSNLQQRPNLQQRLDPPLRGESYSTEHLWEHAQAVARRQQRARRGVGDRSFIDRFESNCRFIATTYQTIIESVRERESITPDAEWLVDNYYVVQEQLREIREDLPLSFYRELPKLASEPFAGYPRVYELAHELVLHSDSSLDEELITGFVESFQRIAPLTSGEIWATPIMLRLVLVENLRRLCGHMQATRGCHRQAQELLRSWQEGETQLVMLTDEPECSTLVMELIECLRESAAGSAGFGMHELIERLGRPQEFLDECVRREEQRLAANQVSIGNAITSMRLISALDWSVFFERVSLIEQTLRRDPGGVYASMDFATRDHYRHVIEDLAKRGGHDETHVAATVLDAALAAQQRDAGDWRRVHVGYYLIDKGRFQLERLLAYRPRIGERLVRAAKRRVNFVYLGGIELLTVAVVAFLVAGIVAAGGSIVAATILGALAVLPASELAAGVVNFLVTFAIRPQMLPKLDFAERIPHDHHTLVAMPTMLTSIQNVTSLLERLEIQYLANPVAGLSFALLTDFVDAPQESTPEDEELLAAAQAGIDALNERFPCDDGERFYLLHRRRQWNPTEHAWMGWERKRGKLTELNRLLRGATDTSYLVSETTRVQLLKVRFVVTLDSDTRLPHAAARRLAGALAHPLNRPFFDPAQRRVVRGYGVLQPRVSVSLASAGHSWFARIFSNGGGLDPYCTAVSDVYQDLFSEASYTGKGIYDVDAFKAAADATFPTDHILSHDLIEGCFARVGAVTDIELFDEYPTRFDADAQRQHRWVRGDWQLLPWLLSAVPTPNGMVLNPLTLISRWKIFDNLRRSLVPLAFALFWVAGWYLFPSTAWVSTVFAVTVLVSPFLFHVVSTALTWPRGDTVRQHLGDVIRTLGRTLLQCVLSLAFLPVRAASNADAIARTLYRLFVSRRKLLEWETADAAERRLKQRRRSIVVSMSWASFVCLALAIVLPSPVRWLAMPVLALWFLSPWIAHILSQPIVRAIEALSADDRATLRRIARRTWAFFEAFVGPEDNWLPPDNYQEFPQPRIAHRISPTNEGMFVLSAVAARDLGYLGVLDLAALLERNIDNWAILDRHRGHFYNWYDTTTRLPLMPRYVSSADSGNLAASFLAAQQGLLDVLDAPLFSPSLADGVVDSVRLVEDALARLQPRGARFVSPAMDALDSRLSSLRKTAVAKPTDLAGWSEWIQKLRAGAVRLPELLDALQKSLGLKAAEFSSKMGFLKAHIDGLGNDSDVFIAWLAALSPAKVPQAVELAWQAAWGAFIAELGESISLNQLSDLPTRLAPHLAALRLALTDPGPSLTAETAQECGDWLDKFAADLQSCSERASICRERILWLGSRYESLAMEMDFTLLYNPQRRLFSVGFNLEDGRLDRAHYDLLASEARIASQVAIAKGDADHRHWFQLGRAITETSLGSRGLLSWGGTMFEYLMPMLLSQYVSGSLLERSCDAAVERQIAYGRQRRVAWGISESAFAAFGVNSDYHYQSFGVPGLGLKRGLGKDLVISPYSTALALAIKPAEAVENLRILAAEGAEGPWGYYDAVDYTPDRVPEGERRAVVFCYMTHHQGMSLVALVNCLFDHRMQRRYQRQPLIRSTELLLQERTPLAVLQFQPQDDSSATVPPLPVMPGPVSRRITTPATATPRAHLLSNGQYHVMLTNAGGGYSAFRELALTRWRADATCDDWGQFVYLRNLADGKLWSAAHQPTRAAADAYEVTYSVDKAEFRRRDGTLETHLEIAISPESNVEVRQLTLTNHGRRPATVDVTSYAEIVLAGAAADAAHPAFSKLFVETEYIEECHALLARRRPRDATSAPAWAVHVLAAPAAALIDVEFETDRARFLGRGRTPADPAALEPGAQLSGTTGPVLDAIFSLRSRLHLTSDESASLAFVTGYAESRDEALHLADQFRDLRVVQRTFEMAWARSQVEMRHLHVSPASLQLYQRLVSALLFPDASLRAAADVIQANRRGQTSLWRYGISGDDPIVLVRVTNPSHRSLLRELLLAHEFWHAHGLKADLVVVNENPAGYFDSFQEQLLELIHTTGRMPLYKPGGVYLLRAAQLSEEDSTLLQAVAAINFHGEQGSLSKQVDSATVPRRAEPPLLQPVRAIASQTTALTVEPERLEPEYEYPTRYGGFDRQGDYIMQLRSGEQTLLPWSNVVANPRFGFLCTESGGGYTWAANSRENKLTSWSNDPISDSPSEIIYIRDEETGRFWSPTPLPLRDDAEYRIQHGRGYSQFGHSVDGIQCDLLISIAPKVCVKFACLKVKNTSGQPRTLSATYYAEWVLGVNRQMTQTHVRTSRDEATGALLAHNSYHEDFPQQTAVLHVLGGADSVTGDRREFLGRNGSAAKPAAMSRVKLSDATGAGMDACGAVQKKFTLAPGQEIEIIFLLGWSDGGGSVADLIALFESPSHAHAAIEQTRAFWQQTRSAIEVSTPNRALDLLVNHWLLYQTLSCRVWGRSAFYQSGGAYGFRDQLQDVMALVYSLPQVAQQVILQAASRQFEQGDVQHWWHPPTGRGVRTRFADDYFWLPFVVSHYVSTTGDAEILDERIAYLHSPPLEPHEHERYEVPSASTLTEDLFGHCLRAIDHGFRFGSHGLPLMGGGDWNDGMNRVGVEGQGESVWLGWFQAVVIERFLPLIENRGDLERAAAYRAQAEQLRQAIEREAWDVAWYRRAFFDDGTPLGSHQNDECKIDSLAQSWSVIAGGDPGRSAVAMQSAEKWLVREEDRLVLLLTPPFDQTPLDPGYIKGYPPGIRENGGQYTHAAMWMIQALALQGRGGRAVELFDLLNPILSATAPNGEEVYRAEPYVVAADVYSRPPHIGRGGWTWYTGSAAWMYRVAIESILGIQVRGDRLMMAPCIPADWTEYEVILRRGETSWRIRVLNPRGLEHGSVEFVVDGESMASDEVPLIEDDREHLVEATLHPNGGPGAPGGLPAARLTDDRPDR